MLPTDDLALPGAYLAQDGTNAAYPFGHQTITFLRDLNTNISRLAERLGIENIYAIYGDNAPTDMQYQVSQTGAALGTPELWHNGVVSSSGIVEQNAGDDLIPASSMALQSNGLLPSLDARNEAKIDDVESQQKNLGPARHKEILSQAQVQTAFIPRYLGLISPTLTLPFKTSPRAPVEYSQNFRNLGVCAGRKRVVCQISEVFRWLI